MTVIEVDCPQCKAPPGERCIDTRQAKEWTPDLNVRWTVSLHMSRCTALKRAKALSHSLQRMTMRDRAIALARSTDTAAPPGILDKIERELLRAYEEGREVFREQVEKEQADRQILLAYVAGLLSSMESDTKRPPPLYEVIKRLKTLQDMIVPPQ